MMDREDFKEFLNAVKEKNEVLINSIISRRGILQRSFGFNKVTLLHVVAERGTVETAAKMCDLGVEIDALNRSGKPPICYAFSHSKEMVQLLLDHGASLSIKGSQRVSLLKEALFAGSEEIVSIVLNKIFETYQIKKNAHLVTVYSNEEIVRALLQHKWDLRLQAKDYPLLIFFAARTGDAKLLKLTLRDCLKYLYTDHVSIQQSEKKKENVARSPKELNFQGYYHRTALHYAVKKQLPDVVRFLLEAGADVNCKTSYGFTPLHYAVGLGNEEICRILLDFGAKVNPNHYLNPLYLVCGRSRARIILTLSNGYYYEKIYGTYTSAFMGECRSCFTFNLTIMELLLQYKANPDTPSDEGTMPLLEACRAGRLDVVKLLLEFCANIGVLDKNGNSALHYAALSSNIEMVAFLLSKRLNIEAKNHVGCTPFLLAVQKHWRTGTMIEYLADKGAIITASVCHGSALSYVSEFDSLNLIDVLLASDEHYKLKAQLNILLLRYATGREDFNGDLKLCHRYIVAFKAMKDETMGNYIMRHAEDEFQFNNMKATHEHFKKCKLEVARMKSTKLVTLSKHSFHDFLTSNIYFAVRMIRDEEVRSALANYKYQEVFPCYEYLLRRRFQRVVGLENDVVGMEGFMQNFGQKCHLPLLVMDRVLSYLHLKDFRNFGRSLSGKQH